MEPNIEYIKDTLIGLARGKSEDFNSILGHVLIETVNESEISCYFLKVDSNGRERLVELIQLICRKITDYAIPRSKIQRAFDLAVSTGSSDEITNLALEARKLFTKVSMSGEGGELLLFCLVESILKYPQVLCKMNLKTDENLHVNGADGVFLGVDDTGDLCIFWGESKLHSSHGSAISECIESIASILKMEKEVDSDLRLIDFIDLNNSPLETALIEYFDIKSEKYERLRSCAVCLVAFNYKEYSRDGKISNDDLIKCVESDFRKYWFKNIECKLKENGLNNCKIVFFYVPMKSVEDFRVKFRNTLGLGA